ncbi:hypothetical protein CI109_101090 [Kwoniella shandongensis]|uniref:Uncharacterized protein n=1 Tax=Kwoniella shandongensis TaxID=1734106 RepID=A0A5M6C8Q6_9TREE|nr:uncharacterized protein CI109_001558 [Kwoniella shandongensis]KAA5530152.1 hypothetical protein CI109_001558 [Kwoniella shandongensis]
MVFHITDFTDSEPEAESEAGGASFAGREHEDDTRDGDGRSEAPLESAGGQSEVEEVEERKVTIKSESGGSGSSHPLRITLRPNLNHLMHAEPSSSSSSAPKSKPKSKSKSTKSKSSTSASVAARHQPSDRSSLSPPPPITLKLGMKHALAEKAAYSSSEEDEEEEHQRPPPSKKKKTASKTSSPQTNTHAGGGGKGKNKLQPPPPLTTTTNMLSTTSASGSGSGVPAQHRKSYDWLQPSAAGASHHGPPEREKEGVPPPPHASGSATSSKITGWSPAEEAIGGLLDDVLPHDSPSSSKGKTGESGSKPKKSHKKRPADAPPGPGKAWRKGIKKGMVIPWKDEDEHGDSMTPPTHAASMSREGSPEPFDLMQRQQSEQSPSLPLPPTIAPAPAPVPVFVRAPSPPFIPADPAQLGFPVFSKPIVPPKIQLGAFPRVTQNFAPVNGGDTGPFPRREKVRSWKFAEKITLGVGGGQLKIKSWARGPPSELGRLIQADKEAKELSKLQRLKPSTPTPSLAATTTAPLDYLSPIGGGLGLGHEPRPPFTTNTSFDGSVTPLTLDKDVERDMEGGEEYSEFGGGDDESVVGSVAGVGGTVTPPVGNATPSGGGKKTAVGVSAPKSKTTKSKAPRKSKLAQEIVPTEDNSEIEPTPVATPVP